MEKTSLFLVAITMFANTEVSEKYNWPKQLGVMPLINILFTVEDKTYHHATLLLPNYPSKNKALF